MGQIRLIWESRNFRFIKKSIESDPFDFCKNDLEHQLDFNGRGFPYDEALRRTTRELEKEFNKLRKMKPEDREKELNRFLKCR